MSHPNPHHDRENEYPSDDYRPRKVRLNKTQRATKRMLSVAGNTFRKKGESHLEHLKRLTKSDALKKKLK